MAFCANCGSEAGTGAFCTNCGKANLTQPPAPEAAQYIPVPPPAYEAPKKAAPKKALFAVAGGVGVLAVGAIILATTLSAPLKLDAATAEEVLFTARDFSVDLVSAEDPISLTESDNPIFNVGEQCEPDARLAAMLSANGTLLATSDFNSAKSGIYVHQDIIEFDSVESAEQFMAVTREGLAFPDCEYNNTDESSTFITNFTVLGDTQDVYGVTSDDSVIWAEDQVIIAPSLGFDLSSDSQVGVIRQNNYVLVLSGTVYRDTTDAGSIRDIEADFEVITQQFVSGKRAN